MIPMLCPASLAGDVNPASNAAIEASSAVPSNPFSSCSPPPITFSAPRPARLKNPPVSAVIPTSMSPDTAAAAIGCAASKNLNCASSPSCAK